MNRNWLESSSERAAFLEIVEKLAEPIVRKRCRLLPGKVEENAEEVIAELRLQLLGRQNAFLKKVAAKGDERNSVDSEATTNDEAVWSCDDARAAAKKIYENYLLLELIKRIVARQQKVLLRHSQSEMIEAIATPPSRNEHLEEQLSQVFSTAEKLFKNKYPEFCEQWERRVKVKTEDFVPLTAAERQKFGRMMAKIRAAVLASLFGIAILALPARSGAESTGLRSFDGRHDGMHQGRVALQVSDEAAPHQG